MVDPTKITDRLREAMRQKLEETGTEVAPLARQAGVPRSSLRGFLDGGNRVQLAHAVAVCDALDIRMDLVLYGRLRRSKKLAKAGGQS